MVLSTHYYRDIGSSRRPKVCRLLIYKGSIYKPEGKIRQILGCIVGSISLLRPNTGRIGQSGQVLYLVLNDHLTTIRRVTDPRTVPLPVLVGSFVP